MSGGRVVHVGDVAGVAATLVRGINDHTSWEALHVPVPVFRPSTNPLWRVAQLGFTGARLLGPVSHQVGRSRADVVHVHWAQHLPWVRTRGRPLAVHVHGSDVRHRAGTIAFRPVERALRRADLVVAVTPDLAAYLPVDSTLLPNPIDTRFWFADEPGEPGRVLIHCALTERKGGRALVEIAERLVDAGARVVAFGGGEYEGDARRVGVEVLPRGGPEDVRRELRASSVVVGQLRYRVLGLSELEAMACARPVVMSVDRNLVPDAPVVGADTPEEVASRVLSLIADSELAGELGARGRSFVGTHHDLIGVVRRLVALYEDLV